MQLITQLINKKSELLLTLFSCQNAYLSANFHKGITHIKRQI